jgi:hypothetical protein
MPQNTRRRTIYDSAIRASRQLAGGRRARAACKVHWHEAKEIAATVPRLMTKIYRDFALR